MRPMAGTAVVRLGEELLAEGKDVEELSSSQRRRVESWLAALLQTEHLSLLVGNGLSTAVGAIVGTAPPSMAQNLDAGSRSVNIQAHAEKTAKQAHRTRNLEDEIRSAMALAEGLDVLGDTAGAKEVRDAIDAAMQGLIEGVLTFERALRDGHQSRSTQAVDAERLLQRFLMPFAARPTSRDRLAVFTTNYDRVIEFAADLLGLRIVDRFVGALEPTFNASRLDVDMHYSPPGVRGEPRYVEGLIRLSKLHGSVDWRSRGGQVVRSPIAFGAEPTEPQFPKSPSESVLIYPNPAKDVETLTHPYAELFRDLAASICRPGSVLVTYGYGFGDSHINRVITDMLTIPSTHLVVISYGAIAALDEMKKSVFPPSQTTEIIGPSVAALDQLVQLVPSVASFDLIEAQARHAERVKRVVDATKDAATSEEGAAGL